MVPLGSVLNHLGTLHAYETVLVLVVAFGPFLVIAFLVRREHLRSAARDRAESRLPGGPGPGPADREPRARDS